MDTPAYILAALAQFKANNALRKLSLPADGVDFTSNDYLGLKDARLDINDQNTPAGAGGSRLLSGNYPAHEACEAFCASWLSGESALLFHSGYTANLGVLSCLPQRQDTILYDALSHASIKDGIRLSRATAQKFRHNDLADLEKKIEAAAGQVFVVTESLFSMDGDKAPLTEMAELCSKAGAFLIVDEAHSTGLFGEKGAGLCVKYGIEDQVLARIHTFGKAVGRGGAVVISNAAVREYLLNRSRTFIYTTGPGPLETLHLQAALEATANADAERTQLFANIALWESIFPDFAVAKSPIQPVLIPGNDAVKAIAGALQAQGWDVRPIISPTVPKGQERVRVILHSFNQPEEIQAFGHQLKHFLNSLPTKEES